MAAAPVEAPGQELELALRHAVDGARAIDKRAEDAAERGRLLNIKFAQAIGRHAADVRRTVIVPAADQGNPQPLPGSLDGRADALRGPAENGGVGGLGWLPGSGLPDGHRAVDGAFDPRPHDLVEQVVLRVAEALRDEVAQVRVPRPFALRASRLADPQRRRGSRRQVLHRQPRNRPRVVKHRAPTWRGGPTMQAGAVPVLGGAELPVALRMTEHARRRHGRPHAGFAHAHR
jgi:hypothetical protein